MLLRLLYLAPSTMFTFMRLVPMSDREKDLEILALRHQLAVLQHTVDRPVTTVYERGLARLIHHEIDHLNGLVYTARMRTGVDPIPVEERRQTGRAWAYE
ncbi:hypothetical protein ACWY4P_43725 [Streptomyces sp. LZ34]